MNTGPESSSRANCVVLPAICTLKEAVGVKALLMEGLDASGNVEIDGGAIERVDTSALQLLAAFVHDMTEAGRLVTWVGATDELKRSVWQLGMARELALAEG
jgi:anti-anti-sigma regulatory factor